MATAAALRSVVDIESFIHEYFDAWVGTDEDQIMSCYAENVTVQIPGTLMQGKSALREQFVRPFIAGFPGNRHAVKNWIFGRDVVAVEWNFEAEHKGRVFAQARTAVLNQGAHGATFSFSIPCAEEGQPGTVRGTSAVR